MLISGTRADDFDLFPKSASDKRDSIESSYSYYLQSRSMRSNSQPPSPSSFSTTHHYKNSSSGNSNSGDISTRNSSLSHLCYSQEFVENHLKSTAEMASQFDIRKVLLIGACRMFKDFLLNYKMCRLEEVIEFVRVKIEFIRTECKKLSLLAETIYITTASYNVISQMDFINEIVDNLTKIERDVECACSNVKYGSSNSIKSVRSTSLTSFSYDFKRAQSSALEAVDEVPLQKGITLLLLRRNLERRTNRMISKTLLETTTIKEEEQSDKLYLQEEIGLVPQEFQFTLTNFYNAQRGGSFCSINDLISDEVYEDKL